jgi:site-specific DNA recombinase
MKAIVRRCAIYTRKSSEEGLDQSFNSLDAQREACEAYIKSQSHEGWQLVPKPYDDGGYSGGSMERPGLKALIADVEKGEINIVVVYKVDRLTRALADFAKIVDVLDKRGASFVSVTQQFNTTSSMGRLTLNVLLSFAQFEREVTGERIRDKIAASKKKGMFMGGYAPLGYDIKDRALVVNESEAATVRTIFARFVDLGAVPALLDDLRRRGLSSKRWTSRPGVEHGGAPFTRGALYHLLRNRLYLGQTRHRDTYYPGAHKAIVPKAVWDKANALLDSHRTTRPKGRRTGLSHVLTGYLFDDRGNRMSPSHVRKKDGRRYRYYVSQALLQHRAAASGSLRRVPAQPLEDLVLDRLRRAASGSAAPIDASELHSTPELDRLRRIEIGRTVVRIMLATPIGDDMNPAATLPAGDRVSIEGGTMTITVPIQLCAWGGETVIRGADGRAASGVAHIDAALVATLAQAYVWREQLESGEATSLTEIAAAQGVHESHIRQRIGLAFLAPDIVEAMVNGTQPRHLTLDRFIGEDLPLGWHDQRALLLG